MNLIGKQINENSSDWYAEMQFYKSNQYILGNR